MPPFSSNAAILDLRKATLLLGWAPVPVFDGTSGAWLVVALPLALFFCCKAAMRSLRDTAGCGGFVLVKSWLDTVKLGEKKHAR